MFGSSEEYRELRRVVITGIGIVSSIGTGVDSFLSGLRSGASGMSPIRAFDTTGFAFANGCEVTTPVPVLPDCGRAAQFAGAAAGQAVADAGLDPEDLRSLPCTVVLGTTDGESRDLDDLVAQQCAAGDDSIDPVVAGRVQPLRMSAMVAKALELCDAEVLTMPTACAAGNYAIGYGFDAVRSGESEIALVGGADALCRKTFTGFYRLGTIAQDVCRPFDVDRQGILTGEGAAVLVLEPLESALARGAQIYAEILGYGLACDALHPVAPDWSGVARCMSIALESAGVAPTEVDLISAHGTGTKANDVTECMALADIYGSRIPRTISIKSMVGHSMGAASALGAAASALALRYQFIPPTINHRQTDPECAVDCVPNQSVEAELTVVQNNGLAFGGNNAVVVLGRVAA